MEMAPFFDTWDRKIWETAGEKISYGLVVTFIQVWFPFQTCMLGFFSWLSRGANDSLGKYSWLERKEWFFFTLQSVLSRKLISIINNDQEAMMMLWEYISYEWTPRSKPASWWEKQELKLEFHFFWSSIGLRTKVHERQRSAGNCQTFAIDFCASFCVGLCFCC